MNKIWSAWDSSKDDTIAVGDLKALMKYVETDYKFTYGYCKWLTDWAFDEDGDYSRDYDGGNMTTENILIEQVPLLRDNELEIDPIMPEDTTS